MEGHPKVGSGSLYLKFEEVIQELARMEAKNQNNDKLIVIGQEEYNTAMNTLNNYLLDPVVPLQAGVSLQEKINIAANMYNTSNTAIEPILSGRQDPYRYR